MYKNKPLRLFLISFACENFFGQIIGAGGLFMISFLMFVGASEQQIGMIASIPALANVFQIFSCFLYSRFKSRKKVISSLYFIQYLIIYLIIITPKIPNLKIRIYFIIICYFVSFLSKALIGGGLDQWTYFYVPNAIKGSYFSNRNLVANAMYIVVSLIIGNILNKENGRYEVYFIIFMITIIFSIVQVFLLSKIDDCNEDLQENKNYSIKNIFLMPLKDKVYRHYIIFILWWSFAINLSSPYYNVYCIKYLKFNYSYVAAVGSITCFLKLVIAKVWGKLGDKNGWKNVILMAGCGYAFTNGLWFLIGPSTAYLYPVLIIINGLCMIGANICIFNINFEVSNEENRLVYFGACSSIVGIFSFISPNITAFIVKFMKGHTYNIFSFTINPYQLIFLIGGILQFLSIVYLVSHIYKTPRQIISKQKQSV